MLSIDNSPRSMASASIIPVSALVTDPVSNSVPASALMNAGRTGAGAPRSTVTAATRRERRPASRARWGVSPGSPVAAGTGRAAASTQHAATASTATSTTHSQIVPITASRPSLAPARSRRAHRSLLHLRRARPGDQRMVTVSLARYAQTAGTLSWPGLTADCLPSIAAPGARSRAAPA